MKTPDYQWKIEAVVYGLLAAVTFASALQSQAAWIEALRLAAILGAFWVIWQASTAFAGLKAQGLLKSRLVVAMLIILLPVGGGWILGREIRQG